MQPSATQTRTAAENAEWKNAVSAYGDGEPNLASWNFINESLRRIDGVRRPPDLGIIKHRQGAEGDADPVFLLDVVRGAWYFSQ